MRKPRVRVRASGRRRCPLCRVDFIGQANTHACTGCGVTYHRDCMLEMGGCATLGCDRAGVGPDAPTPTVQTRRVRWGRVRDAARERRRDRRHMRELHQEELGQLDAATRDRARAALQEDPWVSWDNVGSFFLLLLEILFNCLFFVVVLFAGLLRLLVEVA